MELNINVLKDEANKELNFIIKNFYNGKLNMEVWAHDAVQRLLDRKEYNNKEDLIYDLLDNDRYKVADVSKLSKSELVYEYFYDFLKDRMYTAFDKALREKMNL